jgi:hypothetical protein
VSEIEESSGPEVIDAPRPGSLAWLQALPSVEVQGFELPNVHRIPEGGSLVVGDDDGRCRVTFPDGHRCGATRVRAYGVCIVHAGGGGFIDPKEMSRKALAVKLARRERRELLGIGPRRAASARQIARVHAIERAEQLAAALVDGPLDDESLGSIERQQAALRAIDATFPLASVSAELSIPSDADGVAAMGWSEMRALAAQLLEDSS